MHPTGYCLIIFLFTYLGGSDAYDPELSNSTDSASSSSNEVSFEEHNSHMGFQADQLDMKGCGVKDFPYYAARGQETTLRQVLLVHRHGDRTPIKFHDEDPLKDEAFWKFHGYGQLTNRGKQRIHMLGKLMRHRYRKFMKGSVNKNLVLTRSSGSSRCIESAQLFLSAFLPLNAPDSPDAEALVWNSGCEDIGRIWQPASVQTMSKSIDGMLAEGECRSLDAEYKKINKTKSAQVIYRGFQEEAKIVQQVLGLKVDIFYKWFWASGQIEIESDYFEQKLGPRLVAIRDRIREAGRLGWIAYQSTAKSRRLRSGLLINDIIENMKKLRQQRDTGLDSKKFIHYSTHDINVFSLLGVLGNVGRFPYPPNFGANIVTELHESDQGEWFVRFFYMSYVPSKLVPIHVDACEIDHPKRLCTLDRLERVMRPYIINDWLSWMYECNNDIDNIDPYAP